MIRPNLVVVMAGVDMFALLIHLYFELDLILKKKMPKNPVKKTGRFFISDDYLDI